MSENDAQNTIKEFLTNRNVGINDKVDLLTAFKTIYTKQFELEDYTVFYTIGDYKKANALAFHESTRGDGKIIVGVDSDFLIDSNKIDFITSILHEYGHQLSSLGPRMQRTLWLSQTARYPQLLPL